MRFINIEKPYVEHSDVITPLYSIRGMVNDKVPRHKDVKFTGYKSPRCTIELKEHGIPMDGTWSMFMLEPAHDGYSDAFLHIFRMLLGKTWHVPLGLDPRAREKGDWLFARTEDVLELLQVCYIFGLGDAIRYSRVLCPEESTECQ